LIVGAGLVGGAALLIHDHIQDNKYVSACFPTNHAEWWTSQAEYLEVKNGMVDKMCGYADNGKLISFDHEKDYFGGGNWIAPTQDNKPRQYLIKKIDPNPPKPTQVPTQAPFEVQDNEVKIDPLVKSPPTKIACPFEYDKSYNLMPPPGCAMFSNEDIGWSKFEGKANAVIVCAVKDHGAIHISEQRLNEDMNKSFKGMSYLKAGPGVHIHLYEEENFTGTELVADTLSKSFIHRKFPGSDLLVNDIVRSMIITSDFDVDAINTCDEYMKFLKGDIIFKVPKMKADH